jgi:hypothetical protein
LFLSITNSVLTSLTAMNDILSYPTFDLPGASPI